MLEGLMQHDHPLTLQHVLRRMRTMNGHEEVVTLTEGEPERISYAAMGERIDRLCHALVELGVKPGDRVATFSWNTQRHLELYLAVPCIGAVLHTLNIRLFPEQLRYIVGHAEDRLLFLDPSLRDAWELSGAEVDRVVELGDEYEALLAGQPEGFDYPELDDRAAAGLCYTSGTTGNPKGVLYSHRSNVLHALSKCLADGVGIRSGDRVLPVVPMFHANAWGFPYSCAMSGATLVMPSRFVAPEPLARAIETERVTVAGAVPTVWLDLLRYADEHAPDLGSLRTVVCGGAAVPESLMRAFEDRHDVHIVQAWGMTETSPLASVAHGEEWDARVRQGRPLPLVETRIVDDDGDEVAWDGEATGELEVRGPTIASAYYRDDDPEKFDRGWLRTGDIASIDPRGSIRLTDRSKDVIKSGGEWISSVDLENALMAHPSVREAAVIARPDERWSERPLACVVLEDGSQLDADDLRRHLLEHVAKWWVPEDFVAIDEVPKTSVGKFDKKVLRGRLQAGELGVAAGGG
jgi:acyl-CoA synthetase (AMP-forming)/AMP-acid ligase II